MKFVQYSEWYIFYLMLYDLGSFFKDKAIFSVYKEIVLIAICF